MEASTSATMEWASASSTGGNRHKRKLEYLAPSEGSGPVAGTAAPGSVPGEAPTPSRMLSACSPAAGAGAAAGRAPLHDPALYKSYSFDYILKPFLTKDHALLTQDPSRPTMCKRHQQLLLDQQHPHHDVTRPVFFPRYYQTTDSRTHRACAVFSYGDCTDGQSKVVQVALAGDTIESATMLMQMNDRIADLATVDDNTIVIAHDHTVSLWSVSELGNSGGSLADLAAAAMASAMETGSAMPSISAPMQPRAGGSYALSNVQFPCRVNMVQALPESVLRQKGIAASDRLLGAGDHMLACLDVEANQVTMQRTEEQSTDVGVISSLEWFPSEGHVFGCTTTAGCLRLFDLRRPQLLATENPKVQTGLFAHAFTGHFTVIAAGLGGAIHVHDIRKITHRVHLINDPFLDDVGEFGIDLANRSLVVFGNPGLTSWTIEKSERLRLNGFHTSRPQDYQGLYFMRGKIVRTRRRAKEDEEDARASHGRFDAAASGDPATSTTPAESGGDTVEAPDESRQYRNSLITVDTCGAFATWELPNFAEIVARAASTSSLTMTTSPSSSSSSASPPAVPSAMPAPGPIVVADPASLTSPVPP